MKTKDRIGNKMLWLRIADGSGLILIRSVLRFWEAVKVENLVRGLISNLAFLVAGLVFALGTILNWNALKVNLTLN